MVFRSGLSCHGEKFLSNQGFDNFMEVAMLFIDYRNGFQLSYLEIRGASHLDPHLSSDIQSTSNPA